MSQIIRPVADITRTNIAAGTFADINEVAPNDANFVRTNALASGSAVYEARLSAPKGKHDGTPLGYATFRVAKVDGSGNLVSDGRTVTLTWAIYQGATLISSGGGSAILAGNWSQQGSSVNLNSVTNWADVRIRFTLTVSGSGTNRGAAISWAQLEVPFLANNGLMAMF